MERFKKDIRVNNEPRAFEFNKMKNMKGVKFFITSTDAKQNLLLLVLNKLMRANGNSFRDLCAGYMKSRVNCLMRSFKCRPRNDHSVATKTDTGSSRTIGTA